MENPGFFTTRPNPIGRTNFKKRAFTVGIGGPVGSGKTGGCFTYPIVNKLEILVVAALVLSLCELLRDQLSLAVVTNDIFTREDWEFLVKNKAIEENRLLAVR